MRFDYLVLTLLWIAYCAIHSALISIRATDFFKRVLDTRYCYYRLFFNAFSVVTLILLLLYSRAPRFQGSLLLIWSGHWRISRYILILAAVILIFSGFRHYSISQFLGIHQIRSRQSASALTESGDLDSTGVLGYIRHPWYLAVFILLWTSDQNTGSIIVNSILSAYLVIGTLLEERKLVLDFGDKYREYQQKASMFIPLKWLDPKHR
jgi:protein-S-isoprenylcysteine O-methyltransferase Ste14